MRIDYYLSPLSPYTYLAGDRLERIAEARGVEIDYLPVDMAAVFEEVGALPVPKRHRFRREYRLQDLERVSRRVGLPINLAPAHWPTDPVPASLAVIAAQDRTRERGEGDPGAVVRNLLEACWARDRDVADPRVIAEALADAGYDGRLAEAEGDAEARARRTLARNTERALEAGVFGAPFYVVGDARFWGQDRLSYLDEHLDRLAGGEDADA